MATALKPLPPPPYSTAGSLRSTSIPSPVNIAASQSRRLISCVTCASRRPVSCEPQTATDFVLLRRNAMAMILAGFVSPMTGLYNTAFAQQYSVTFREHIDTFDGYSFMYPSNWIQVRGAGADIFFRDPFVLDENISVELSSPSSSNYTSVEDLGSPQEAGQKVLKQYLTEFMSTRLGVRRESSILTTSSRVADDGKLYYQVEKYPWDRRYLSVLGVENKQLYELRLQTPESVFAEEENDLRRIMESFRVKKVLPV